MVSVITLALLLTVGCSSKDETENTGNASEDVLRAAVNSVGGVSAEAPRSQKLCELAYPHLQYMADEGNISHDGYSSRSGTILKSGGRKTGEIVAYNSGRTSETDQASACAKSWRTSSEHWKLMSQHWDYACYALLTQGKRTYCIGFFANGNLN